MGINAYAPCRASHKPACGGDLGKGLRKLIIAATNVPLIQEYLQIWLAIQYKMDGATTPAQRRELAQRPLFAHIDVGIEPADIADFHRLWRSDSPDQWSHKGVQGILQFHHMSLPDDWGTANFPITPAMMAYWKQARAQADDKIAGGREWPVVTVQFVNQMRESLLCAVIVLPQAIAIARKKGRIESYLPSTDSIVSLGFHVASYFTCVPTIICGDYPICAHLRYNSFCRHLNLHIRGDTKNTMRLRAPMRQCDKDLILDAKNNVFGHAPRIFKQKLLREDVYKTEGNLDIPFPLSNPTPGSCDPRIGSIMEIAQLNT